MSVETTEAQHRRKADRRQPVDPKPSQAEGDERTIDEALKNAERAESRIPDPESR